MTLVPLGANSHSIVVTLVPLAANSHSIVVTLAPLGVNAHSIVVTLGLRLRFETILLQVQAWAATTKHALSERSRSIPVVNHSRRYIPHSSSQSFQVAAFMFSKICGINPGVHIKT